MLKLTEILFYCIYKGIITLYLVIFLALYFNYHITYSDMFTIINKYKLLILIIITSLSLLGIEWSIISQNWLDSAETGHLNYLLDTLYYLHLVHRFTLISIFITLIVVLYMGYKFDVYFRKNIILSILYIIFIIILEECCLW